MVDVLKESIENKLKEYGLPKFEDLRPNIQEHLLKIQNVINDIVETRKKCIDIYKQSNINVNSVVERVRSFQQENSEKRNMSRQTIYNNREILETYILKYQEEVEKTDIFKQVAKEMEIKNSEISGLNKIILQMRDRDLDEQIYLNKIDQLERENKNLIDQIQKLNELSAINHMNLNELQQKIRIYEKNLAKKVTSISN
ncbi:hypothetical protein Desor_0948 [Desulfosporosinus orientis DSM 765]|uniref:Uncharacterized protein n=1 Tax=Desulfosporosinus orientis (strain ATCC 19365 / DSM 765 / NCIMB 8382 / VKM B-1628 / Singapore I) TaxID=768706 RepID=G7W5H7_DESOD|nr:hypothetical protein [Desulfosporosinus orientis]AET66624.1 hypothetical protein Desor_0948 [Desulfosporosinus orientis DSM 765]